MGTIVGGILFLSCILFFTYAYYNWKSENTTVDLVIKESNRTGCTLGDDVNALNIGPVLDLRDGVAASFSVGTEDAEGGVTSVYLDITSISSNLLVDYFKYAIVEKAPDAKDFDYDNPVISGNFKNFKVGENAVTSSLVVPGAGIYEYKFIVYIDGTVYNDPNIQENSLVSNLKFGDCGAKKHNPVITYNDNGGVGCETVSDTVTYGKPYGNLCKPTREGYTFVGWFTFDFKDKPMRYYGSTYSDAKKQCEEEFGDGDNENCLWKHYNNVGIEEGRRVASYLDTDIVEIEQDTTFYAGWKKNSKALKLTYDLNGGDAGNCSSGSKTVYTEDLYGDLCTPTREGYYFLGWFSSEYKDSPLNYYADSNSSLKPICNDKYGNSYDETCLFGHYMGTGKKDNYRISQHVSSDIVSETSDFTLYAGWTTNIYKVTLSKSLEKTHKNDSDGTNVVYYKYNQTSQLLGKDEKPCYYYTSEKLDVCVKNGDSAEIPVRHGLRFKGYYTEPDGKGERRSWDTGQFTGNMYSTIGDKTVYDSWETQTITITYYANTGKWIKNDGTEDERTKWSETVTFGQKYTMQSNWYSKKGHTFGGWSTDSKANDGHGWTAGKEYIWNWDNGEYGIADNELHLYALWNAKEFEVIYDGNGGTYWNGSDHVKTWSNKATFGQEYKVLTNKDFFTYSNNEFLGWSTKKNVPDKYPWVPGTTYTWTYDNGDSGINENKLILYALWKANDCGTGKHTWNAYGNEKTISAITGGGASSMTTGDCIGSARGRGVYCSVCHKLAYSSGEYTTQFLCPGFIPPGWSYYDDGN